MAYHTISENSAFLGLEYPDGARGVWVENRTAFLFSSSEALAAFRKAVHFPHHSILYRVNGWSGLLKTLQDLQSAGCALIAINPEDNPMQAGPIQEVIERVQQVIDGHFDNGTHPN